ncbi:hypothetical protein AB9P05_16745 [Roseivirga sp. BDSF3-8]|uniref:hypothetical protein n=1 Tax=Roseivirga sp. BDSF3-8 TaxID=3241598 RepID=UPI003531F727
MKAIRSFSACLVIAIALQVNADATFKVEEAESKTPVEAVASHYYQRKPAKESIRQQQKLAEPAFRLTQLHTPSLASATSTPPIRRYLVFCSFLC